MGTRCAFPFRGFAFLVLETAFEVHVGPDVAGAVIIDDRPGRRGCLCRRAIVDDFLDRCPRQGLHSAVTADLRDHGGPCSASVTGGRKGLRGGFLQGA